MASDGAGTSACWASVQSSKFAKATKNPIRAIVDNMDLSGNPKKKMIPLSIGDPTVFGNLLPAKLFKETLIENIRSNKYNGYPHSAGYPMAREAVAHNYSSTEAPYTAADVVIASGCSGALDIAINCLAQEGQNVLFPCPGFSLYETIAGSKSVETRKYNLDAETGWEIDIEHMESLIDDNTACIILNNPSNPCGSVFSKQHIIDVLAVAERRRVPIIADEVYANMVFEGEEFHSVASLAANVPVLTCGGIAKRFLVPGWRLGWVLIHDPIGVFAEQVRPGLNALSQLILGSCSLIQSALPVVLEGTPKDFFRDVLSHLESNSKFCFEKLSAIDGLKPIMPKGAMYIMVGIDIAQFEGLADDVEFTQALLKEQSVFCLPATVFGSPNFFRIVTTVPSPLMAEAMERTAEFCRAHRKTPVV